MNAGSDSTDAPHGAVRPAGAGWGRTLPVIASIEEPQVIAKILAHLEKAVPDQHPAELPLGADRTGVLHGGMPFHAAAIAAFGSPGIYRILRRAFEIPTLPG